MLSHKGDYTKYLNFTSNPIIQSPPTVSMMLSPSIPYNLQKLFNYGYTAIYRIQQPLALNTKEFILGNKKSAI